MPQDGRSVANPPERPLLIYDGDCQFCCFWIERWKRHTGARVDYRASQDDEVRSRYPEIPERAFDEGVRLVEPSGRVVGGVEAVFRIRELGDPALHWPMGCYRSLPGFAAVSNFLYHWVARHRGVSSWWTRLLWGSRVEPASHRLVRWWFLRFLALIYLTAFLSLWSQIDGLLGSRGILPAAQYRDGAASFFADRAIGLDRYRQLPTLVWWDASDGFLQGLCAVGVAAGILLLLGVTPAASLIVLWVSYLSLVGVGQVFLSFQWDILLLEVGFLAIFFAPGHLWMRPGREREPSRVVLWLFRILLFKLIFASGWVKLLSGDLMWRHLTALTVHYQTQPIPNAIAWYVHQLPEGFHRFACGLMFLIEIPLALLILAPRRLRWIGLGSQVLLQLLIMLTGNYCFFNLLTLALCWLLLDDQSASRILPVTALNRRFSIPGPARRVRGLRPWFSFALALLLVPLTVYQLARLFRWHPQWMGPVARLNAWMSPFRICNSYGLFAVMTPNRPEIIVQGSQDGSVWRDYGFPYKPGALDRRPPFVAPYQPRLDWQMWFAALGSYRSNPWFVRFCIRLLEGSPDVLALISDNPFPDRPPRFIRAVLYDYQFTDFRSRKRSNHWWRRRERGIYLPAISLREAAADANQGQGRRSASGIGPSARALVFQEVDVPIEHEPVPASWMDGTPANLVR